MRSLGFAFGMTGMLIVFVMVYRLLPCCSHLAHEPLRA